MRAFLLFFFPSSPVEAAGLEVFFADFAPSVGLAGALEAVEAGALPAVEAGLGAIANEVGCWARTRTRKRDGGQGQSYEFH